MPKTLAASSTQRKSLRNELGASLDNSSCFGNTYPMDGDLSAELHDLANREFKK